MPALVFLAIALSIIGGIHYYIWARLIRDAALTTPWKAIATAVLVLLGLSIPLAFFIGRQLPANVRAWLMPVPYTWLGIILILLVAMIGWDLFRLVYGASRLVRGSGPLDPERRIFLSQIGATLITLTAGIESAAALYIARHNPRLKKLEVRLSRLPREMDGYTIVQLTDLHIGLTLGRPWVEKVVAGTNALNADLIAITGDLVDGRPAQLRNDVAPLAELKSKDGVFFVTGNHEYYSGADPWLAELEAMGIVTLRNERVSIQRNGSAFDLAGIDDYSSVGMAPGHGPDLPRALAGRNPETEVVLMAHQPRAVLEAAKHDVGLVLSGHTHGGQIWPWKYLVHLQQPYVSGLHQHGPRTQIYVSDGTGFWGPPMRLGTRGEITLITLRAAL